MVVGTSVGVRRQRQQGRKSDDDVLINQACLERSYFLGPEIAIMEEGQYDSQTNLKSPILPTIPSFEYDINAD